MYDLMPPRVYVSIHKLINFAQLIRFFLYILTSTIEQIIKWCAWLVNNDIFFF